VSAPGKGAATVERLVTRDSGKRTIGASMIATNERLSSEYPTRLLEFREHLPIRAIATRPTSLLRE
jgi:hypothetical protein